MSYIKKKDIKREKRTKRGRGKERRTDRMRQTRENVLNKNVDG